MADDMEMEFGPDILTLSDEDGVEYTFEVIDAVDIGEERYMALIPYEEENEGSESESEFVILKVVEEDGEEVLVPVENEEELNTAFETFMNRLDDLYELREEQK